MRDYERWLEHYDDPSSQLSWRLHQVQEWLRGDLDRRTRPTRIVSVCAGDGRDVIDVLGGGDSVGASAVLLESHPGIAGRAAERAHAAGLTTIDVRVCDAASTDSYVGAVPADIVLLVGVLGNVSDEGLMATIAATPQMCAPSATLIWSRGRDHDDLNDRVREQFRVAGFTELDYAEADHGSGPALGMVRYDGPPVSLELGRHLFTFWR